jgi:hypothetical protein
LEEPGKTKLVTLVKPGDSKVLAGLDSGDEVRLNTHSHKASIVTGEGKYIGCLPDDLALRLKNLIKSGNRYQVLVKSIEPKVITVFIREVEKGPKVADIQSFPVEKIDYVAFTPPELVHKEGPSMEQTESIEEFG